MYSICNQRLCMGLLEYRAMTSLHDIAHDEWLCTFTIKQQLEIPSARCWAAPVRETGTVRKRQTIGPVHPRNKSHLPGHSPPSSQASHRVRPAL